MIEVASVVVLGIFDRAYGKPKDFDPSEERRPMKIDLSRLTHAQKVAMLEILRTGVLSEAGPEPDQRPPGQIEGAAE